MTFPSSPYLGQLAIESGCLWRYNGLTWSPVRLGTTHALPPSCGDTGLTLESLEARITAIEEALENGFLLLE